MQSGEYGSRAASAKPLKFIAKRPISIRIHVKIFNDFQTVLEGLIHGNGAAAGEAARGLCYF
jgi:hypothetical protein